MADTKIDRKMNLVIPVYQDDGTTVYVHAMPIDRTVFEANFMLFAKAFGAIYGEGLSYFSGPRVAMLLLREIAKFMGDAVLKSVDASLIPEMRRLANIVIQDPGKGWQTIPYDEAIRKNLLNSEDIGEVDNAMAFFTVAWHMHTRQERVEVTASAAGQWGASLSSLNCTEYATSLPTSTATGDTGLKAAE